MTFKDVLENRKLAFQKNLDAIDAEFAKTVEVATVKAKTDAKNIKFQIKRLDTMLETYTEYAAEFDAYTLEGKASTVTTHTPGA